MRDLKVVDKEDVAFFENNVDLFLVNDIDQLVEVLSGNWCVIAVDTG